MCKYFFFGSLYTVVGTSFRTRMGGGRWPSSHIMFIVPPPTIPFFWGFLFGCLLKVVMGNASPPYPPLPYHHQYKTHLVYLVHFGKPRRAGESCFGKGIVLYKHHLYLYFVQSVLNYWHTFDALLEIGIFEVQ